MGFKNLDLGSSNSQFYRLKDGDNKLRIVSEPVPVWTAFDRINKTARKYLTAEGAAKDPEAKRRWSMWVLDRDDSNLPKLAEFGSSIMNQIQDYANDTDYGFDELPPFDFKIKRSGVGMDTEYNVMPLAKVELTDEEKREIASLESVVDIIKKDAQDGKDVIPF